MYLYIFILTWFCGALSADTLTSFEQASITPCQHNGRWVQYSAAPAYFQQSFIEIDNKLQAVTSARAIHPTHQLADSRALISAVGRILPRLSDAKDLAPLQIQFRQAKLSPVESEHHTEYLRLALMRQYLRLDTKAAAVMADFLHQLLQLETGWQLLAAGLDINETPAQLLQRQQAIYSSWNTEIAPRFKTLLAQHEPEQLNILLHDDVSYLCQQANNND